MASSVRSLLARSLRVDATGRHSLSSILSPLQCQRATRDSNAWFVVPGFVTSSRYVCSAAELSEINPDDLQSEVKANDNHNALHTAISSVTGDFCCESSMLSLQRFFSSRRLPVIPTGSLKLDLALGIGGLPKGRMVEIYGQEASGKTTLALHIIKEAQKLGGYCAYLDVENAMDCSLAESIGVSTENLLISQPDCAENLLCMVDTLAKSGALDVIVVDSVAALIPQSEIDASLGATYRDTQSQIMTKALRRIHSSLHLSQTLIVFVNQVRSKVTPGKVFGRAEEVTCGGNALPFYAAIRMRMSRTGMIKTDDKVTGLGICVQVVKNKLAPPMKKAELGIQFGRGICCEPEVLDLACEHGIIMKQGGNYFIGKRLFHNKHDAEDYLVENQRVLNKIVDSLRSKLLPRQSS